MGILPLHQVLFRHKVDMSYTMNQVFCGDLVVAFSSLARILGECSTIHSLPTLFFFFFFEVEISLRTQIPLFMPGSNHSGSVGWDNCGWMFPDKFCVGSLTMPEQRHSQPTPTSLGQGVRVFRCNQPPALLAEWSGSFMCHCTSTGVEQTPNKSQQAKVTLEKKILLLLLPGFKLATFRSRVRRLFPISYPSSLGAIHEWSLHNDIQPKTPLL